MFRFFFLLGLPFILYLLSSPSFPCLLVALLPFFICRYFLNHFSFPFFFTFSNLVYHVFFLFFAYYADYFCFFLLLFPISMCAHAREPYLSIIIGQIGYFIVHLSLRRLSEIVKKYLCLMFKTKIKWICYIWTPFRVGGGWREVYVSVSVCGVSTDAYYGETTNGKSWKLR